VSPRLEATLSVNRQTVGFVELAGHEISLCLESGQLARRFAQFPGELQSRQLDLQFLQRCIGSDLTLRGMTHAEIPQGQANLYLVFAQAAVGLQAVRAMCQREGRTARQQRAGRFGFRLQFGLPVGGRARRRTQRPGGFKGLTKGNDMILGVRHRQANAQPGEDGNASPQQG
jgi:hypothetical protein